MVIVTYLFESSGSGLFASYHSGRLQTKMGSCRSAVRILVTRARENACSLVRDQFLNSLTDFHFKRTSNKRPLGHNLLT